MAIQDNFDNYFTLMLSGLKEIYPELEAGTVYKDTPPSFPYMYFRQMDGIAAAQTLSQTESGMHLSVQIEIYSIETLSEARSISKEARDFMMDSLGFRCTYYAPVENSGDPSIYRFLGRYQKIDV